MDDAANMAEEGQGALVPASASATVVVQRGPSGSGGGHAALSHSKEPSAADAAHLFVFCNNKAGMADVDKERVNSIVLEMSKNSPFYKHELRQAERGGKQIEAMKAKVARLGESELAKAQVLADREERRLEETRRYDRVCCVVDMDAFFVACELRDRPDLRELPVAVGGGVVCTANYVARQYGVRSAMPGFIADRLCPKLVWLKTNFDKYTEASRQIQAIFLEYDKKMMAASLDEAYLDLTEVVKARAQEAGAAIPPTHRASVVDQQQHDDDDDDQDESEQERHDGHEYDEYWQIADKLVHEIRMRIFQETKLTASAGIGTSFVLAKIAADIRKPFNQFRVEDIKAFMQDLPVRKICGIGRVTERVLSEGLGIHTCGDMYNKRALLFACYLPGSASWYLGCSMGLGSGKDESESTKESVRKGMSREETFKAISDKDLLLGKCRELCESVARDLSQSGFEGRTLTVKLKDTDFNVTSRSSTSGHNISSADDLYRVASKLLDAEMPIALRLLGVRMSKLRKVVGGKGSLDAYLQSGGSTPNKVSPGGKPASSPLSAAAAHGSSSNSAKTTVCPLCSERLEGMTNGQVNDHIDGCLEASQKEEEDDDEEEEEQDRCGGDEDKKVAAEQSRTRRGRQQQQQQQQQDEEVVEEKEDADGEAPSCPLCDKDLGGLSNQEINGHVDRCLGHESGGQPSQGKGVGAKRAGQGEHHRGGTGKRHKKAATAARGKQKEGSKQSKVDRFLAHRHGHRLASRWGGLPRE